MLRRASPRAQPYPRVAPKHLRMADGADRRAVAGAHAGRAHDAHIGAELRRKIAQQMLGARHRAGERIAHPHRDRRRRRLAFLHHVEMRVEGRDLVDLGQRKLHLGRERGEMRGREMPVSVLDQVQMLDQEIASARLPPKQELAHLVERRRVDLPALGRARAAGAGRRAPAPFVLVFERVVVLIGAFPAAPSCRFAAPAQSPPPDATIEIFYRRDYASISRSLGQTPCSTSSNI